MPLHYGSTRPRTTNERLRPLLPRSFVKQRSRAIKKGPSIKLAKLSATAVAGALLCGLTSLAAAPAEASGFPAAFSGQMNIVGHETGPGDDDDNLPVYTSPIDVTRGRIQLRPVAPDRDSGKPIDVAIPDGLLGPQMRKITDTPLGTQMDENWNRKDPKTRRTPRDEACDRIKAQVQDRVSAIDSGFSAYDISCNLGTTGEVLAKQVGSAVYLSYQLHNMVDFHVTTPGTFHRNHRCPWPSPLSLGVCQDDPHLSVQFVSDTWTVLNTHGVCHITAEDGTVNVHAVKIDSHNFSGDVARKIVDPLFLGNKFSAAELAMQAAEQHVSLPLDDSLKELRKSAPCTNRSHPAFLAVAAFRNVEPSIDPAQGIIIRIIHPPIAAPRFQNVDLPSGPNTCKQGFVWREAFKGDTVCVMPQTRTQAAADNAQAAARREPNGGAWGPNTCKPGFVWRVARPEDLVCVTPETRSQTAAENAQASAHRVLGPTTPSFSRPSLSTQPIVKAGSTMQVNGQLFPLNLDLATVMSLRLEHDSTACNGGATELEWGPAGGSMRMERLPRGAASSCASRYEARNLAPATAYHFRARDCDFITCSPWSPPLRLTTQASGTSKGTVVLTLDKTSGVGGGIPLGTAMVNAQGTFEATVSIPASTTAGPHTIFAVSGDASADTSVQVTASGSGGGKAKIVLTGSFFGDRGCASRPLDDPVAGIDSPFPIFGVGFAPGTVTIHVDSATGMELGTATVKADGTFCRDDFQGPPASLLGDHTLVAVQNGTVQDTTPVKFTRPPIIR